MRQIFTFRCNSWGESAGAISVALQLLTNGGDTEGLFRGAFMESGSPIPTSDMSGGQTTYDTLVKETDCAGSSDTLQCLREVPYDEFLAAMDRTPNIFSWEVSLLFWCPLCYIEKRNLVSKFDMGTTR